MSHKTCTGYNGYCVAPEKWQGKRQPLSHFLIYKTGKESNYCKYCRHRAAGYSQRQRAQKGMKPKEEGVINLYRSIPWSQNLGCLNCPYEDCLEQKCPIYFPVYKNNGRRRL